MAVHGDIDNEARLHECCLIPLGISFPSMSKNETHSLEKFGTLLLYARSFGSFHIWFSFPHVLLVVCWIMSGKGDHHQARKQLRPSAMTRPQTTGGLVPRCKYIKDSHNMKQAPQMWKITLWKGGTSGRNRR